MEKIMSFLSFEWSEQQQLFAVKMYEVFQKEWSLFDLFSGTPSSPYIINSRSSKRFPSQVSRFQMPWDHTIWKKARRHASVCCHGSAVRRIWTISFPGMGSGGSILTLCKRYSGIHVIKQQYRRPKRAQ